MFVALSCSSVLLCDGGPSKLIRHTTLVWLLPCVFTISFCKIAFAEVAPPLDFSHWIGSLLSGLFINMLCPLAQPRHLSRAHMEHGDW